MHREKLSTPPRNIADLYAESRFKKSSTAPFLNVTSGASVTDKELPVRDRFAAAARLANPTTCTVARLRARYVCVH